MVKLYSDETVVLSEDIDDSINVPDSWDTPLGTLIWIYVECVAVILFYVFILKSPASYHVFNFFSIVHSDKHAEGKHQKNDNENSQYGRFILRVSVVGLVINYWPNIPNIWRIYENISLTLS